MVAEIKGSESSVVASANQRATAVETRQNKPATDRPADAANAKDSVSLTRTAEQLHKLEQAVKASTGVDSSRVDHIRQSIANGTYQIDNQKLADKLTGFESMMQQPSPSKGS